jgi:glycosyltransferase involved in cell wall biosynthesis
VNNIASLHIDAGRAFRAPERRVLHLLGGLVERGHRVLLCAPRRAPLFLRAQESGIPCEPLTLRSGLDFPSAVRLARLVGNGPYDLVHAHDAQSHSIARAAQGISQEAALCENLFVTHHGVSDEHGSVEHMRYANDGVHHIAASKRVRDALVDRGVHAARIAIIPNAVDLEMLRAAGGNDPWGLRARGMRVIGTVGELTREKNPALLLQAFATLRKQMPNAHLLMVGSGPLRKSVRKRAAELGVDDAVTFAEGVEEPAAAYAALDVFALSSDFEGPCTGILDAMGAGKPVVTTATAGVLSLARHGTSALVVPPRDSDALAQAMALVLQQPDLASRLVEGARLVAEEHSVDHMIDATLAAYQQLGAKQDAEPR